VEAAERELPSALSHLGGALARAPSPAGRADWAAVGSVAADGRGLSLAHNRPRVFASSQLFYSLISAVLKPRLFTTTDATNKLPRKASSLKRNKCEHGLSPSPTPPPRTRRHRLRFTSTTSGSASCRTRPRGWTARGACCRCPQARCSPGAATRACGCGARRNPTGEGGGVDYLHSCVEYPKP
jgi:hypothetical protein